MIEFGLVGQTMHQVDERTPVSDLEKLTKIYRGVLDRYFALVVIASEAKQSSLTTRRKNWIASSLCSSQ